jgi:gluconate 2-dehydrogenase gamma chain
MSADDMSETSRRKFLVASMTGLSATWVAANWDSAVAATGDIPPGTSTTFFTPSQAADVEAISAQIIPTTDTPGAKEARVVAFIDLALVSFAKNSQDVYTKGLADLSQKSRAVNANVDGFAGLTPAQQTQVLTSIEKTPFFQAVRSHTIMGMFAAPQHGGNYQKIGWKLVDFDDSLNFEPPFGYYDRA